MDTIAPKIKFDSDEVYGRFVIEPLDRGYGITLGNALRRILLSSLPGAAPTHVKIEGVMHEFSTIEGVKEDTTDIILNLKKLTLKLESDRPKILRLEVKGEGIVTAADFRPDPEVEILNPDLYIATLDNDNSVMSMEVRVMNGKGYLPADKQDEGEDFIGQIPVDSIFTPIKKVNYLVEDTRVGQVTNFDRLILEVWTNGCLAPYEAVSAASRILKEQFNFFEALKPPSAEAGVPKTEAKDEVFYTPVENLEFSVRSLNCLRRAGIKTIGELTTKSEKEIMKFKNFGQKSLQEIKEKLASLGLSLKPEEE